MKAKRTIAEDAALRGEAAMKLSPSRQLECAAYRLGLKATTAKKNPKHRKRAKRLSTGKRRVSGLTVVKKTRKVTRAKHNPAFGKRKSQAHIVEAVHLKPLKFWYWNGHAVEDKSTHAFIFPTRAAAYAKAKEIRNQLPQGFKALRVIPK